VSAPGQPQIELVEPAGDRSPVTRFLEQGGGLHHVCYEVDDLAEQLGYMHSVGAMVLRNPRPATAFENRRIAWVTTPDKFLIEYLEREKQRDSA
jgi:methylmalonyl-CoA/ethylmalonyl-CoA epimerase